MSLCDVNRNSEELYKACRPLPVEVPCLTEPVLINWTVMTMRTSVDFVGEVDAVNVQFHSQVDRPPTVFLA